MQHLKPTTANDHPQDRQPPQVVPRAFYASLTSATSGDQRQQIEISSAPAAGHLEITEAPPRRGFSCAAGEGDRERYGGAQGRCLLAVVPERSGSWTSLPTPRGHPIDGQRLSRVTRVADRLRLVDQLLDELLDPIPARLGLTRERIDVSIEGGQNAAHDADREHGQ